MSNARPDRAYWDMKRGYELGEFGMGTGDFKTFLEEKTVLPKDAAGWIDLFLADLNVPEISSFTELKTYLDKHVEGSNKKERLKSVPHYWEEYEKSLKKEDVQ